MHFPVVRFSHLAEFVYTFLSNMQEIRNDYYYHLPVQVDEKAEQVET